MTDSVIPYCELNRSRISLRYNVTLPADVSFENLSIAVGCSDWRTYDPCTDHCHAEDGAYSDVNRWPEPFASIIYGTIYPGLLVLSVLACVFTLLVLTRPHMRNATNAVLLYMSLAQFMVALVPAPFMIFYYTLGNYKFLNRIQPYWCVMSHLLANDVLPPISNNAATWLAVLLAAQRVIYVRMPIESRRICTVRNVNICTGVIVVASILCSFLQVSAVSRVDVLKFDLFTEDGRFRLHRETSCLFYRSPVLIALTDDLGLKLYLIPRATLFAIIPMLLLIGLTLSLLVFLKENRRRRSRLLEHKEKKRDATSWMLVLVVVVFIIVYLPMGALMLIPLLSMSGVKLSYSDERATAIAMMIDNLLVLTSYPINFAIYCSMSAQFRTTFRAMFLDAPRNYVRNRSNAVNTANNCSEQIPLKSGDPRNHHEEGNDCML